MNQPGGRAVSAGRNPRPARHQSLGTDRDQARPREGVTEAGRSQYPRIFLCSLLAISGIWLPAASPAQALGSGAGAAAVTAPRPAAAFERAFTRWRAGARPMSYCTRERGAVVAVDFGHWGGPIVRSCGTTPTTGYALVNQNGLRTTGTQHDGPAFVCRLSYTGYASGAPRPGAREEPCVLTPGASAYWSYWHAAPGRSTWSYSKLGAMSHEPEPGSVDLWTFGGTDLTGSSGSAVPTVDPDSLRPAAPAPAEPEVPGKPAPTGAGGTAPGASADGGVSGVRTGAGARPGAAAGAGSAASPGLSGTGLSGTGPSPAAATPQTPLRTVTGSALPAGSSREPGQPQVVLDAGLPGDGSNTAADSSAFDAGSPAPALITLGIVLLLGGAGVFHALRRPRRED
ncbi:MAG: hypothetical protein QG608_3736 [Actinomycetota bacterium]|nr:hypothetical protein [Actinomycetota bacterium]